MMLKISEFIIPWMLQFMLCYGLDFVRHNHENFHQLEFYLIVFDRFQKIWFPWRMECDGWKKIPLHFIRYSHMHILYQPTLNYVYTCTLLFPTIRSSIWLFLTVFKNSGFRDGWNVTDGRNSLHFDKMLYYIVPHVPVLPPTYSKSSLQLYESLYDNRTVI